MCDDPFGELRSVLHEPPSPGRWGRLAALLESWLDADDLATRVVPYVQSHLRDDPHPRPAPQRWLDALERDPDVPLHALQLTDGITWAPSHYAADDSFARALLGRGVVSGLRRLELAYTPLAEDTLRALAAAATSLDVLTLWNALEVAVDEPLEGWALERLTSLDLGGNLLRDVSWHEASIGASLTHLRLAVSVLEGGEGALASAPFMANLRSLDVRHSSLRGDGMAEVLGALSPNLKALRLGGCEIDERAMTTLCDGPFAPRLEHLDLGGACHLDEARAFDAFYGGRVLLSNGLTFERYGTSFVGFDGAELIARSSSMTSLRRLDLHELYPGEGELAALGSAEHLRSVRHLDVSLNTLGDDGVEALLQTALCDGLLTLDVSFNATTTALADVLVNAPSLRALRALSLRGAELGPIGVRWLSRAPFMSQLESLDLFRNGVDSRVTLQMVLRSLDPSRVRSLDLSDDPLDDRAADALVDADLTALERLVLDHDAFSEHARRLLKRRYPFVHFID
jgi:hypothetical protein